jgi:hypothetical protein
MEKLNTKIIKTVVCECCKRNVHMNRASLWNRDGRICRDCIDIMWRTDRGIGDLKVIGNRVREKHGLPPIDSE